MNSALLQALAQILIMYGPAAYKAFVDLMHTTNPTKDDYMKLLDFATQKSYDDYIAEAKAAAAGGPK